MTLVQYFSQQSMGFDRLAHCILVTLALCLAACSSPLKQVPAGKDSRPASASTTSNATAAKPAPNTAPVLPKANSGRGGYYQDDGPGDDIPEGLESTVDPIPVVEPYSRTGNKPYKVFGKEYIPINDSTTPFKQRGVASWYGKKFHGKRTSSGEPYDMYKITAAHPLLPIPSYARVTNLSNGKQIIVRINDRGPFHSSRIMDLSYTAALKLGYLGKGSSEVELERLLPEDIARMAENSQNQIAQTGSSNSAAAAAPIAHSTRTANTEKESVSLEAMIAAQERKQQSDNAVATVGTTTTANAADQIIKTPLKSANTVEPTTSSDKTNFYLQFAAFAIRANAEASMAQLKLLLNSKAQATQNQAEIPLEIVQQGNLYRLQSGPYPQRELAQRAAQELAVGSAKPIVVQR